MLFYCDNVYNITNFEYYKLLSSMPSKRKEKILRYIKHEDRVLSVVSYALFKYATHLMGLSWSENDIETNQYGKPFIRGNRFYFNISHTANAVACAIELTDIGVDIQEKIVEYDGLIERVCTTYEMKRILCSKCPEQQFTKFWTLKESFVKCIGTGIWDDISHLDFSAFEADTGKMYGYHFLCESAEDYCFSVCSAVEQAIRKVPLEDILKS